MNCLWESVARTKYLKGMVRRYSSVTLPIGPAQGFSVQAIFQPLKLRRDPLAAEDLVREERRALLGEPRYSDEDPRRVFPDNWRSRGRARQTPPVALAENADEALKKSPKRSMVFLGGPGTGKTTLLKYLAGDRAKKALADLSAPLPIFISLPDLARSSKTLKEYLTSTIQDMIVDERFAQVLWKALEQGKALVCLDSLDEVAPKLRPERVELINEWASSTDSTYIVGSRFTDYKGGQLKGEWFTEWELQPMNPLLCRELASRLLPELYRLMFPGNTPTANNSLAFVSALEDHEQVAAWSENPLLFSLAAVVFVRTGTLPLSRAELYQQVVNAILETRELDRSRRDMLGSVLADLALELFQEKGRTFTYTDLLRLLPIVRKRQDEQWDTEEIAFRIINSGLLEVVAHNTYGFRHQTFQEYLAAAELAQRLISKDQVIQRKAWKLAWSKHTYSRWVEVLCLMVSVLVQNHGEKGAQKAGDWLRALMHQSKRPEGDPGNLSLVLALRALSEIVGAKAGKWYEVEGKEIEEEIAKIWITELLNGTRLVRVQKRLEDLAWEVAHLNTQAVGVVVEQLVTILESGDEDQQDCQTAMQILQVLAEGVSVERLVALLDNSNRLVRMAAVQALGILGKRTPVERLVALLRNPDKGLRLVAIRSLGKLGELAPVEELEALIEDPDEEVRRAAVYAMAELGERVPVNLLLALFNDPDNSIGFAAQEVLESLGELAPMEELKTLLDDPDANKRLRAVYVLAELCEQVPELVPVERLMMLSEDNDKQVRLAVVYALEMLNEQVPELVPVERLMMLLEDNDEEVRLAAVQAVRMVSEQVPELVPVERLVMLLEDNDEEVRHEALQVLGDIVARVPEKAPMGQLKAQLESTDKTMRWLAGQALGELDELAPVEELEALLEDPDEIVRKIAVRAMAKLGVQTSVDRLVALLDDPDQDVRREVINGLWKLGKRRLVEQLVANIHERNWKEREIAIRVLGRFGDRASLEHLMALLEDPDEYVRLAALWSLRKLGERAPVERLVALLEDPDENIRLATIVALGGLGEKAPMERLVMLLGDNDEEVRVRAVLALGKLGERAPVERLTGLLKDPDENVRLATIFALGGLGEKAPVEHLMALLEDQDVVIRIAAILALGVLSERAPVERLMGLLEDADENVRLVARHVVEMLQGQVPLSEPNASRDINSEALSRPKNQESMQALLDRLYDEDSNVRLAAVEALGKFEEGVPLKLILVALSDREEQVRIAAAEVLQRIFPDTLSAIVSEATTILLRQGSGSIISSRSRVWTAQTISFLQGPSPALLKQLINLLNWPHWEVQVEAIQALGKVRRNIPDEAIKRLYNLRLNSPSLLVQAVADDTLAEILSLETGVEDD